MKSKTELNNDELYFMNNNDVNRLKSVKMKIDYSKTEFTQDERRYMTNEVNRLKEINPTYIPILIQLESNILKMDKQKFLVSNDINFNDFVNNTLKKKLINLYKSDVLVLHVVNFNSQGNVKYIDIKPCAIEMKDIYDKYKDPETNLLIFKVSRMTTYKWVKGCVNYFLGY